MIYIHTYGIGKFGKEIRRTVHETRNQQKRRKKFSAVSSRLTATQKTRLNAGRLSTCAMFWKAKCQSLSTT